MTPPAMATLRLPFNVYPDPFSDAFDNITVLVRTIPVPAHVPTTFTFSHIDPQRRLPILQDLGIRLRFDVASTEYDPDTGTTLLRLYPIELDPRLSEESVALAIGMLREAKWAFETEEDTEWPDTWHRCQRDARSVVPFSGSGLAAAAAAAVDAADQGEDEDEDEEPFDPTPQQKRRKRRHGGKSAESEENPGHDADG